MSGNASVDDVQHFEVAVIGAGFGALALLHRLSVDGIDDVVIFERDDGVGGTWRANHYPGAACDVPSHLYSLSFALNPDWSRSYASQPEILAYIERTYESFGFTERVRPNTTVRSATWDDERQHWVIRSDDGATTTARVLVSAIGMFHTPAEPHLVGLNDFGGTIFHSARWRDDHAMAGRRVAVIGTGASAIQVVPAIAPEVAQLDLYQRTPAWIMPRNDEPFSRAEREAFASDPEHARKYRNDLFELYEQNTLFFSGDPSIEMIKGMGLDHLEGAVVDPDLRARLTPHYLVGCKRILVSSDFYPALQRDNVELISSGIDHVSPDGIVDVDGRERPCDTIVLCTGFKATEYLHGIDVFGRSSANIHDTWAGRPRAYLGMMVPSYPNFFMMYGPNTNQGGNSILVILEAQAQFIASALETMRVSGARSVEVAVEAMDRYVADLEASLAKTVWHEGCDSYFRTAAGDVVTQLPYTARWYQGSTHSLDPADFSLPGSDRDPSTMTP